MAIEEDEYSYSDEEIDEKKHEKLLDKVLSLNKVQQLKKPSRTEPTLKVSEFDLVKSVTGKKGSIYLDDLTKVLEKRKNHVNIKKKVDISNKISKTLPKPLEKPTADRIRRTVAYEKARLELDRWEPIITSNRVSTNLTFPLPTGKDDKKEDMTSRWKLKTIFDIEMEKNNPPQIEEIHVDVEQQKFTMSMKEILEQRKETAKLRAHQSYREAKARRQNKIKSKKYHRVKRKEKIKQQLKEFELLQKTDPEEALKRLDEIEKIRAHERFSLRHKSTGKWAKNKQIRAKYDKESRQELAQQLTLSKELTQKINTETDSEDDLTPPEEVKINSSEENNPWLVNFKFDNEIKDYIADYKKYWLEKNVESKTNEEGREKQSVTLEINTSDGQIFRNDADENEETNNSSYFEKNKNYSFKITPSPKKISNIVSSKTKLKETSNNSLSTTDWNVETMQNENIDAVFDKLQKSFGSKVQKKLNNIRRNLDGKKSRKKRKIFDEENSLLTLPNQKKRPNIDEPLLENLNLNDANDETNNDTLMLKSILQKKDHGIGERKIDVANIDPNKFMKVKVTPLDSAIPDFSTNVGDDEEIDENSFQKELVAEAFHDDDILEEFRKEKSDEIERYKPKDINLALPGWGSWGGTGVVPSKRKQRRFIVKVPKKVERRDDNKGFLIIKEDTSNKVKEHMVNELPFPFQRVKDFEASIRAPIGRTFVPETAFRKFTKPAIRTKLGATIEPMDKDELLNKSC